MTNYDRVHLRFDYSKGQVCISRRSASELRNILKQSASALKTLHCTNTNELAAELDNAVEQLDNAEKRWKAQEDR